MKHFVLLISLTTQLNNYIGGAMSINNSTVLFSGSVIMFRYNLAAYGGALSINDLRSRVTSSAHQLFFIALLRSRGGAINTRGTLTFTAFSFFIKNTTTLGGAIYTDGNFSVSGEKQF